MGYCYPVLQCACHCRAGFEGEDCSLRTCDGPGLGGCHGRGMCVNGTCFCRRGWDGPNCDVQHCPGGCNGHGVCNGVGCVCDKGWAGERCDEAACDGFHYSCVLYLSTQGEDFEGGSFTFNDPADGAGGGRVLSPLAPSAGTAVVFSSGWENIHGIRRVSRGRRWAMTSMFMLVGDGLAAEDHDQHGRAFYEQCVRHHDGCGGCGAARWSAAGVSEHYSSHTYHPHLEAVHTAVNNFVAISK